MRKYESEKVTKIANNYHLINPEAQFLSCHCFMYTGEEILRNLWSIKIFSLPWTRKIVTLVVVLVIIVLKVIIWV